MKSLWHSTPGRRVIHPIGKHTDRLYLLAVPLCCYLVSQRDHQQMTLLVPGPVTVFIVCSHEGSRGSAECTRLDHVTSKRHRSVCFYTELRG